MREAATNLRIRKEPAETAVAELSPRARKRRLIRLLAATRDERLGSRTANDRNEFAERPLFDEVLASLHT